MNKIFTSVIFKCSYLFSDSKTMATLVNYTCKSFIKLAPDKGLVKTYRGGGGWAGAERGWVMTF